MTNQIESIQVSITSEQFEGIKNRYSDVRMFETHLSNSKRTLYDVYIEDVCIFSLNHSEWFDGDNVYERFTITF